MGTATLVPIEEYLSTSYEDGDREYVDGEVLERNLGEFDHSDYLDFGVTNVWVIDPETKTAVAYTQTGITSISEGPLRTSNPEIELPLAELF
jgi:hypothetical protein